ncbi:hypothetical protein GHR85_18650 [Salmonella enterica subsp. enterica serovar Typhimurium]|nr:hypothetical protein [Salmonella enterica subsp. enterica serovar Typhimurium]
MHSSFGLPYPAGHWFYSLQDLLDNPVFMVSFFVFWVSTGTLLIRTAFRKINISEICILFLLLTLIILSLCIFVTLKVSFN